MELTIGGLASREEFERAGIGLPAFDVARMQRDGKLDPRWVHIGPGNIFRIFIARLAQEMTAAGHRWPVTAVVPLDPVELDVQLARHDLMTLGVTLNPDGTRGLEVIAGVCEGLATRREEDSLRFAEIARSDRAALVSLTITEKGYAVRDSAGRLTGAVAEEIASDPRGRHSHAMALLAGFLLHRYEAGGAPITLLSCDNFSHNGDKLRDSVLTIVDGWTAAGSVPRGFAEWVKDREKVAFPISVIDKITPRPSESVAADLAGLGFSDMGVETPVSTPLAGFVNSEPAEYLVVEDAFAAERPPFEDFGVHVVERRVCDDFEHMKVTTCLNPLHTALAVAGCLLRFPTIDSEMRDPALAALVHRLAWDEGLPVVVDPGIVAPADFLTEVERVRFPNRYLPDDPARIAMDTSQKLPIRFGETLKKYIDRGLDLDSLTAMPLVFALWCRYLMGVADDGDPFALSPDPLLDELREHVESLELGDGARTGSRDGAREAEVHAVLEPILSNPAIFAVDLYDTPLAAQVEALFARLIAGPGAVRETLNEETDQK